MREGWGLEKEGDLMLKSQCVFSSNLIKVAELTLVRYYCLLHSLTLIGQKNDAVHLCSSTFN